MMADDKELRQQLQSMAGLVREVEEIADPKARSAVKELVQALLDVHGAALERILERIFETGDMGQHVIDLLGTDPLVGSLLVLYGLHPDDLGTRVEKALRTIAPDLRAHGIDPELLSIHSGEVRLRARVGAQACGSTAASARKMMEDAIYEAAPDVTSLLIEGIDGKPASGFVSLDKLLRSEAVGVTGVLAAHSARGED
jgi:Fe-S cluster biogenesis protein NfuA